MQQELHNGSLKWLFSKSVFISYTTSDKLQPSITLQISSCTQIKKIKYHFNQVKLYI